MTGFLDGVLKPGQGVEIAVKRELETRRKRWPQSHLARPEYVYAGVGDFLLQHGQFWTGREIPERYAHLKGSSGQCYANALAAAEADPTLSYCEGLYSVIGEHFKGHAWCVDEQGGIVEVTAPTDGPTIARARAHLPGGRGQLPWLPVERWGYFGAIVNTEYVRACRDWTEQEFNEVSLFDLSRAEEISQWEIYGARPSWSSSVGWGDNDMDDEDDDWDEDEDHDPDPPLPAYKPREYPIYRQRFDPNRTAL
jgi:hypothetical protein